MKTKSNIQLDLTENERSKLRKQKLKKSDIEDYATDELTIILDVSEHRAKEILALVEFQKIPSIGIKFAKDLVFLGYYDTDSLKEKKGSELLNEYEKKKGFQTDPCVEDQFRLAADYAKNRDQNKNWWDFTEERKKYRAENGYPKNRPKVKWTEVEN